MNWIDWVILGIVGLSGLLSLRRGFVKEALSLIIWVLAFMVARLFSGSLSMLLSDHLADPSVRMILSFGLLFVLTLLAGSLLQLIVSYLVRATGLSMTDRILGMGFGVIRGGLVVVVLIALLRVTPAVENSGWKDSTLVPHFVLMEGWTREMAKEVGRMIWATSQPS